MVLGSGGGKYAKLGSTLKTLETNRINTGAMIANCFKFFIEVPEKCVLGVLLFKIYYSCFK